MNDKDGNKINIGDIVVFKLDNHNLMFGKVTKKDFYSAARGRNGYLAYAHIIPLNNNYFFISDVQREFVELKSFQFKKIINPLDITVILLKNCI